MADGDANVNGKSFYKEDILKHYMPVKSIVLKILYHISGDI